MSGKVLDKVDRPRRRLGCRIFGHRYWYYDDPETADFVYGCVKCKDPALIDDRLHVEPVPGQPGYVRVDPAYFDRMAVRLRMLARR